MWPVNEWEKMSLDLCEFCLCETVFADIMWESFSSISSGHQDKNGLIRCDKHRDWWQLSASTAKEKWNLCFQASKNTANSTFNSLFFLVYLKKAPKSGLTYAPATHSPSGWNSSAVWAELRLYVGSRKCHSGCQFTAPPSGTSSRAPGAALHGRCC